MLEIIVVISSKYSDDFYGKNIILKKEQDKYNINYIEGINTSIIDKNTKLILVDESHFNPLFDYLNENNIEFKLVCDHSECRDIELSGDNIPQEFTSDNELGKFVNPIIEEIKNINKENESFYSSSLDNNLQSLLEKLNPKTKKENPLESTSDDSQQAENIEIPISVLVIDDDDKYLKKISESIKSAEIEFHTSLSSNFKLIPLKHHYKAVEGEEDLKKTLLFFNESFDKESLRKGLRDVQAVLIDYKLSKSNEPHLVTDVAKLVKRHLPNAVIYLITQEELFTAFMKLNPLDQGTIFKFDGYFSKEDMFLKGHIDELVKSIHAMLRKRYDAPFWNSLNRFVTEPNAGWHSLPVGRGASSRSSSTIEDFVDFYGKSYFLTETSTAIEPLDSLLSPQGSILEAMKKASEAFGSEETYFVTNGTSTANKIVLQALVNDGDYVLIDRTCHISHHYGLALSSAKPVYLEPKYYLKYGIAGGVKMDEITKKLDEPLKNGRLPSAIILTNCTFDGLFTDPKNIVMAVEKWITANLEKIRHLLNSDSPTEFSEIELRKNVFQKIAFFFDEAWCATARFHPRLVRFTAMEAARQLIEGDSFYHSCLRFYSTQSTHKSLSSFRQGSMIHIHDALMNEGRSDQAQHSLRRKMKAQKSHLDKVEAQQSRFKQAFLTHTSTSPNASIIASLDVARRQAVLEGTRLVDQAVEMAEKMKEVINAKDDKGTDHVKTFKVVKAEELGAYDTKTIDSHNDKANEFEFWLDPTRLTITWDGFDLSGVQLKAMLLNQYGIQINKTTANTILVNITIGKDNTDAINLLRALRDIASSVRCGKSQAKNPKDFPKFTRWHENDGLALRKFLLGKSLKASWKTVNKLIELIRDEHKYVSATFVNPYPPGYPWLVPGQVIDVPTLRNFQDINDVDVHGARKNEKGEWELYVVNENDA